MNILKWTSIGLGIGVLCIACTEKTDKKITTNNKEKIETDSTKSEIEAPRELRTEAIDVEMQLHINDSIAMPFIVDSTELVRFAENQSPGSYENQLDTKTLLLIQKAQENRSNTSETKWILNDAITFSKMDEDAYNKYREEADEFATTSANVYYINSVKWNDSITLNLYRGHSEYGNGMGTQGIRSVYFATMSDDKNIYNFIELASYYSGSDSPVSVEFVTLSHIDNQSNTIKMTEYRKEMEYDYDNDSTITHQQPVVQKTYRIEMDTLILLP